MSALVYSAISLWTCVTSSRPCGTDQRVNHKILVLIACYVESASGVRWERGYKIGWPCQASGLDLSLSVMVWIAHCVGSDVGRVSSQSPPYCTQNTGIQQSPQKKLWRHPRSSALLLNWSKSRSTSHHNLFIHTSQHCWLVNFWQKDGNFGQIPGHFGKYLYICVLCFLFTGNTG